MSSSTEELDVIRRVTAKLPAGRIEPVPGESVGKSETIIIRVEPEVKQRLEDVAQTAGYTLSAFILHAAEKEADAVASGEKPPFRHMGVPSFFRGSIATATEDDDWTHPGYTLAIHVEANAPYEANDKQWMKQVENLIEAAKSGDYERVWNWFRRFYPRCMQLVPRRHWNEFVEGALHGLAQVYPERLGE